MKVLKQFLLSIIVVLSACNLYAPEPRGSKPPIATNKSNLPAKYEPHTDPIILRDPRSNQPQRPKSSISPRDLQVKRDEIFKNKIETVFDKEMAKEKTLSQQDQERLQKLLDSQNKPGSEVTTKEKEKALKDHISTVRSMETGARKNLSEIVSASEKATIKKGLKLTFEMVKNNFDAADPDAKIAPKELTDAEQASLDSFQKLIQRSPELKLYYDAFVKVYEKMLDVIDQDNIKEIKRIRTTLNNFSSAADEIILFTGLTELCETVLINKGNGLSGDKIIDTNSFLSGRKAFEKNFKVPAIKIPVSITRIDITQELLKQRWNKFSERIKDAVSFVSKKISELKKKASYKSDRKDVIKRVKDLIKKYAKKNELIDGIESATDLLASIHRPLRIGQAVSSSRETMVLRDIYLDKGAGQSLFRKVDSALYDIAIMESSTFSRPLDIQSKTFIKDIVITLSKAIDTLTYSQLTSKGKTELVADIVGLCDALNGKVYTTSDAILDVVKPSGPTIESSFDDTFLLDETNDQDVNAEDDDEWPDEWDDYDYEDDENDQQVLEENSIN